MNEMQHTKESGTSTPSMALRSFGEQHISPTLRVLVLAPHPDDFDAIAVTLRYLHDQGNPIFVAVVSGSHSGVLDDFVGPDPETKREVREQEQRNSATFFGLPPENLAFLRLPEDDNGDPIEDDAAETAIRRHVDSVAPDLVFLPHGNDTNVGHQRTCTMFQRIAADISKPLTAYYIHDPKTRQICTDTYMAFGEEKAKWKGELLLHHESQHHRNLKLRGHGFDDRILKVNRAIAADLELAEPYAEAFETEHFNHN